MAQEVQPLKTNFTAGEISQRLFGRSDVGKYLNGAWFLENFIVMPHGGVVARPGSRFVHEVVDSTQFNFLIPFEFSETESYVLAFGETTIHFYSNNGIVTEATKAITGATQADPVVITATAHGYSDGDHVIINDVVGMTELNGKTFIVANKTANTFEITDVDGVDIDGTAFTAYSSGGTAERIFTIASPYADTDVAQIQVAQSADVMYLVHPSYAPRKLARTSHTSWALSIPTFTSVTFSATDDFPAAVAFFEERLWFGGTNNDAQTIWASKSDSFEDFTAGSNPDDALIYTISADQINPIRWLSGGKAMAIGTQGGEFLAKASDDNEAITPTNIRINRESTHGSAKLPTVKIGRSTLFTQRASRKIREFSYSFEEDGFVSPDITILSEHIIRPGVDDIAYQQEPNSNVWIVRSDGQIATLTFQKEQEVFGWSRQILGGAFSTGDAIVESVAVIPAAQEDQVWLVVKRTINGVTRRYVEYLTEPFYDEEDASRVKEDAIQVDSSLTYSGSAVTTVSGLDHLEGETVSILADGNVKPDATVTNGQVTVPVAASKITVGLSYIPKMRTLPFIVGNPKGSAIGRITNVSHVIFLFFQTLGGFVGGDEDFMEEISFNEDGVTMDSSPDLLTGPLRVAIPSDPGYTRLPYIQYEQRQPLPVTILALSPELRVNP